MKGLAIVLLCMLCVFSVKNECGNEAEALKESKLSAGEALLLAKKDGAVVFEDGDVTAGQSVWERFVSDVDAGKCASVKLTYYYTLGDASHYDPEYYESIKDEYPAIYNKELFFDGKVFTIESMEDGKKISKTYPYLMKYEGKPNSETAIFSDYVYYVLVNDNSVTWDEIEWGMFSSQSDAWIEHEQVYSDLTYK